MKKKLHPDIGDAKALAKASDLARCVILFELPDGRVGYSSYGKDRRTCKSTSEIMDDYFTDIEQRFQGDTEQGRHF